MRYSLHSENDQFVGVDLETRPQEKGAVPGPLWLANTVRVFLPHGFPSTVRPWYVPYTVWSLAASVVSSASGVIATQSLLTAIGVGAPTAIAGAAAVNWVLKDGLGQLGGVLFAAGVHTRFDSDPKRYRILASVALDLAILLEIFTQMFPSLFLPIAAVANIGKNISWLSASSSRAGIHRSFILGENLADVTAKATSQAIAASTLGTALGIACSTITQGAVENTLCVFAVLATIHLSCTYSALCSVELNTLNAQRFSVVSLQFLQHGTVPSISEVAQGEQFISSYRCPLASHSTLDLGAPLPSLCPSLAALQRTRALMGDRPYIITCSNGEKQAAVRILFCSTANSTDVLEGMLAVSKLRSLLASSSSSSSPPSSSSGVELLDALEWTKENASKFLAALHHQGWNTEDLFLEDRPVRIEISSTETS